MKIFPYRKFVTVFYLFRHFIILFFLVNALPLLALLILNQYQLQRQESSLRQFFTDSSLEISQRLSKKYLADEAKHYETVIKAIQFSGLPLERYQTLVGAEEARWLDEAPTRPKNSIQAHSAQRIASSLETMQGDYILARNPKTRRSMLATAFILSLRQNAPRKIILIKPVSIEKVLPNGPYYFEFYAGDRTEPSHFMINAVDPLMKTATHLPSPIFPSKLPGNEPLSPSDRLRGAAPDSPRIFSHKISIRNRQGKIVATMIAYHLDSNLMNPAPKKDLWLGLLILLSGTVSSLIAGYYIKKTFFEPLLLLSSTTQAVQDGNLDVRIDDTRIRQADIRTTIRNFNGMVEQLAEKEQLCKNFIANLTHDLKTPLIAQERTLIMLATEFEQVHLQEPAKLSRSLAKNNRHLLEMINQLLETYQYEEGKLKLEREQVNLPALVDGYFDQLSPLAREQGITLQRDIPENFPPMMVDIQCMSRVFINLIANAIENSPAGTRIRVTGKPVDNEKVEIHIVDNGPGILPEEQSHLFERYYTGHDTRKLGSGLGLYICKILVEAHQGTIDVSSIPGRYTDFAICLPLIKEDRP